MLKKLVKYGNSHALVLDRSILALLNIEGGAAVKLRIEGDALIIKAYTMTEPTESIMLDIESMHDRIRAKTGLSNPIMDMAEAQSKEHCHKIKNNPEAKRALKEWLPGSENFKKLQKEYQPILVKYQKETNVFSTKEWKLSLELLTKKHQGDTTSKEFMKEMLALRLKIVPSMAQMDEEMQAVNKRLGCPDLA